MEATIRLRANARAEANEIIQSFEERFDIANLPWLLCRAADSLVEASKGPTSECCDDDPYGTADKHRNGSSDLKHTTN